MAEPNTPSSSPVVLKKYGNRRLYDTNLSRYVTLHEVEEMVQRGVDMQVLDAKTGQDLTKEILVQIILDKDGAREMLPTGFLKQVVKLSSSPLKETFSRTLQDSLDAFQQGQRAVLDAQRAMMNQVAQMPVPMGWNPFAAFAGPPPSSQVQQTAAHAQPQAQHAAPAMPAGANGAQATSEVDRLRAEVSETQALLRQLIQAQQPAPHAAASRAPARRRRAAR
jgi:polyhydroxyalkanoate synthesis repressor PhaR